MAERHLDTAELGAPALPPAAEAHLARCVVCRAERRVQLATASAPRPAAAEPSPYVLGRRIGAGAMGVVYEARHVANGTRHAVKRLRSADPAMRARGAREGRLQARVDHPNVVPVEDVIVLDGAPALVMPYVDGPPLSDALARGRLPLPIALATFRAIARGVAAIHAAGLVHRDLKPGNVLLEVLPDDVVPRVTDFGLAKAPGDATGTLETRTGSMLGTPAYAAPEQLDDATAAGPAADVFSLGCILFELAAGRLAYRSADRDVLPDLAELPPALRGLCARLLAAEPADRPPDAGSVLVLLDGVLRVAGSELPPLPASLVALADPSARGVRDLPAVPTGFVGREAELAALDAASRETRWTTLTGSPGVGKSWTALHAAQRWPGRATWCALAGCDRLDAALQRIAAAARAGARRDDVLALAGGLAEHGVGLLVLDGVDGLGDPAVRTLADGLGRGAPELRVLATARRDPAVPGARRVALTGLTDVDAVALAGPAAAARGGHPLVLALGGDGGAEALSELVARTLGGLGEAERATWRSLSAFTDAFTLEAAEQVVDAPDVWVPDALVRLTDAGLVAADHGRLRTPRALHDPPPIAALRSHARWYARHGALAALPILWASGGDDAFAREAFEVLAAAERFAGLEAPEAAGVVVAGAHLLAARGAWPLAAALVRHAGALPPWADAAARIAVAGPDGLAPADGDRVIAAARATGDARLIVRAELACARGLARSGRTAEARTRVAPWLSRSDVSPGDRAAALAELGGLQAAEGARDAAMTTLRESVVLADRAGHVVEAARVRATLAELLG